MKQKEIVLHLDCSPRHPKSVWVDIGFICSLPEMSLPVNQIGGMESDIIGNTYMATVEGSMNMMRPLQPATAAFSALLPL